MRVVLAPDSFKESMSATRAAEAMADGVRSVHPDALCVLRPMADGGEGTVAVLADGPGWELREVPVRDPFGRVVSARIGWSAQRRLAVLESAEAVGMHRVPAERRDVLRADSAGVGDLLRAALDLGAQRVIIGLGGTLTSDGGAGLLRSLGVRLLDRDGAELPPGAPIGVAELDCTGLDRRIADGAVQLELACDVRNPLLGAEGAAAVFGPQKGADPAQVAMLESALARMADALDRLAGADSGTRRVADRPGAGAAGGLGAALLALGAHMRPGAGLVAEAIGLAEAISTADLVLTGEGRVDRQSLTGKVPATVCAIAAQAGVPVLVLAGTVADDLAPAALGARAIVPIATGIPLAEALRRGPELLSTATVQAVQEHSGP